MTKLAGISGRLAVKKLSKIGYQISRQKGSHLRLNHRQPEIYKPLTIPLHRELKLGLLYQVIKDANLTPEQFLEL
ncbi:MAG: type II toxin-antitoxin system HicA family toxin [Patescibacteria group bacterium]|jgi:predicted RNA binding protein YcfA (HicA-like mRNA interferase family)